MTMKPFQLHLLPSGYVEFYQQFIDSAHRAFDLLREIGEAAPPRAQLEFEFASNRVFNAYASSKGDVDCP